MGGRVISQQDFKQQLAVLRSGPETRQRAVSNHVRLPEHEQGRWVYAPVVEQELRGLEVLASDIAGVEAEIGIQTVLCGNAGFQVRLNSLRACGAYGFVWDAGKNARMAVEGPASTLA